MSKASKCYIIAGSNGAGKTTFAMKYLPKIADNLNLFSFVEPTVRNHDSPYIY